MARRASRTSFGLAPRSPRVDLVKQRGRGFTIVELLIVVVVIAILAAVTIVSYQGIRASNAPNSTPACTTGAPSTASAPRPTHRPKKREPPAFLRKTLFRTYTRLLSPKV